MNPKLDEIASIEEQREFMRTAPWMPFEDYKSKIYEWHIPRDHQELSLAHDSFGCQSRGNQLIREAAWVLAIQKRPTYNTSWTVDDQKELEEELYNQFMMAMFEAIESSGPWPSEEG